MVLRINVLGIMGKGKYNDLHEMKPTLKELTISFHFWKG